MSSIAMATPSSSRRYAAHSGELMPIITVGASARHAPPRSRTSSAFASFQVGSESSRTPSRSKTTASGIAGASHTVPGMLFRDVVLPTADGSTRGWLQTEGTTIHGLGPGAAPPARGETIDGHGRTLLPGFIDVHT